LLHGVPPCSASLVSEKASEITSRATFEFRCSKRRPAEGTLCFPARDTCFA
jgi:hypothetical protein